MTFQEIWKIKNSSKLQKALNAYSGSDVFEDLILKLESLVEAQPFAESFTMKDEDGDFIRFWCDDLTGWNSRFEDGNRALE